MLVKNIVLAASPSPAHFTLVTTSIPGFSDMSISKEILNFEYNKLIIFNSDSLNEETKKLGSLKVIRLMYQKFDQAILHKQFLHAISSQGMGDI